MSERPNILFLLSDEHSFRFLSARTSERGGEPCRTPTLDSLIERGVHFDAAYCPMPLCTPSRIAMLVGRHSHRCGAWSNGSILRPELSTFASHLARHGYATVAVGKMHLGGSLQYAGFGARPYGDFGGSPGHQNDPLSRLAARAERPGMSMRSRTLDADLSEIPESLLQEQVVVRESLAYLREHRHAHPGQPWLMLSSFSRPHFPLTAPRRFFERYYPNGVTRPRVGRTGDSKDHPMTLGAIRGFRTEEIGEAEMLRARAAYFACVDFLDEILGDFLALLERDGLLENTIVIYTSDHGELAGEHGIWWKNTWHEAATRVPLIISLPEHRNGSLPAREIRIPVGLIDLFPTLCGLTGTPLADGLDGIDLSAAIQGETCPSLTERPGVIAEALTPRWGEGTEFRMIRSERYKYVAFRGCDDLAFDVIADPDEQRNLVGNATGDVAAELAKLRSVLLDPFDFDAVEELRERETAELNEKYAKRIQFSTPNQILLGDGRLVETDAPLYHPEVVSATPADAFDDFPKAMK